MEDIDLSSCSFLTEADDNVSNQSDRINQQQLVLEKQHLEEVNGQLQASIDSLKAQLKEAMEATNTINGMNETISTLKQQLAESKEKEKNLQKDLKKATTDGESATTRLQESLDAALAEKEDALRQLHEEQAHVSKLRKERAQLREDNEEKIQLMDQLALDLKETKSQKKKLRSKFITLAEKLQTSEAANEQATLDLQKANTDKQTIIQDLEAVRIQLSTSKSLNDEAEHALNAVNKDLEIKINTIQSLEDQLEAQRLELEDFNSERQTILQLLQKMHTALSTSESKIDFLKKENDSLRAKTKTQAKKAKPAPGTDISAITLPFEGEMGEKAANIMKLPQYNPAQRLQLVVNEAAKRIAETEAKNAELTKELEAAASKKKSSNEQNPVYCNLLYSLLDELKGIAITEAQFNGCIDCKNDQDFIQFMTDKTAAIEPLIKDQVLKSPSFIPNDFFTSADAEKRKDAIKEHLDDKDLVFAILTSQFLTNQLLKNQVEAIMGPLGKIEELSQMDIIQGGDISDIPGIIKRMQEQLTKLKADRKRLHAALKKAQATQLAQAKADNEQKTKLSQLQIQNESLQNELDVIKVKFQVASNELLLKNQDQSISDFAAQMREDVEDQANEAKARTDRLEEQLAQKTRECADLSGLIKKLQSTLEDASRKQLRRFTRQEEALKAQIIEQQQQLDYMENQLSQKRKAAKRNEKSLKEQYDASVRELNAHYEENKAAFMATIEELREKAKTAREASKKYLQSMTEAEQKNQKLQDAIAEGSNQNKALKTELAQVKQQVAKERQLIQAQLSAQMMACESKIHSATQEAKAESEKHLKGLLDAAAETLGAFYNIDDSEEFGEESYMQVLANAKEDLEKLAYFQAESTKFTAQ